MLIRCFCLCTVLLLLTDNSMAGKIIGEAFGLFPSPDSPEEQKLAAAISSGDLSTVKSAAKKVDLRNVSASGLEKYVLRIGTAEIVRYINSLAELEITPLQIAIIANDLKTVECLFPRLAPRPPFAYRNDRHSPLRLAFESRICRWSSC